jgi:DNA-binding transcriptional LysR family regulator
MANIIQKNRMNAPDDPRGYAGFLAVTRYGGISAAARALGKAPSVIHYDLKKLQDRLSITLFERVGRRLVLTAAGLALRNTVQRALDDIRLAESRIKSGAQTYPLRIASVSGFGRYRFSPRLLCEAPSDRTLHITFGTHDDVLASIIAGDVEYGLTYRKVESPLLQSVEVATEELVLLGSIDAHFTPEAIDDLLWVTYDEYDYVFALWFETILQGQPARLKRIDHFTELEEALASVAAKRGFTIAPKDAWINGMYSAQLTSFKDSGRCNNRIYLLSAPASAKSVDAAWISNLLSS